MDLFKSNDASSPVYECPDCNCVPFEIFPGEWECLCGHEELAPEQKPYINHCWNCGWDINSETCFRSPRPNKGFICRNPTCRCDLQGPVE